MESNSEVLDGKISIGQKIDRMLENCKFIDPNDWRIRIEAWRDGDIGMTLAGMEAVMIWQKVNSKTISPPSLEPFSSTNVQSSMGALLMYLWVSRRALTRLPLCEHTKVCLQPSTFSTRKDSASEAKAKLWRSLVKIAHVSSSEKRYVAGYIHILASWTEVSDYII